jgi:hypothetical protein
MALPCRVHRTPRATARFISSLAAARHCGGNSMRPFGSDGRRMHAHCPAPWASRPSTPTDNAGISSLFEHVRTDRPHLSKIRDAGDFTHQLGLSSADKRSW